MRNKDLYKRLLNKKLISLSSILVLLALVLGSSTTAFSQGVDDGEVVRMVVTQRGIKWEPLVEYGGIALIVSGPGGVVYSAAFGPDAEPVFRLSDANGDGYYKYELLVLPVDGEAASAKVDDAQRGLVEAGGSEAIVLSGGFTILDGRFVIPAVEEAGDAPSVPDAPLAPADFVINDDLIVIGSTCIGFDCVNGYNFGFDTIVLRENNLRIFFDDTSTSASFPRNDWRITINDSANGGANRFSIDDVTGGKTPFTVEAGARTNSLYLEDGSFIGVGTDNPVVLLHTRYGDTPTVRLEQDGSSGWSPQTWDVAGNETNFFIRDATNGSQLPFRIQPGADSNALTIKSTGNIGIGTWEPAYPLEVETTGKASQVVVQRTDGATGKFSALGGKTVFGSVTNHPVEVVVNNAMVAEFNTSGDLTITGTYYPTSDANAKENFTPVDGKEVLAQLENVEITTWNFIGDDGKAVHMGPTSQDFYAAYGLGADDKHISTTDADGVALVAIKELAAQNRALKTENAALRNSVSDLESRMASLETRTGDSAASVAQPLSSNILLIVGLLAGVVLGLGLSVFLLRMVRRNSGSGLLKVG